MSKCDVGSHREFWVSTRRLLSALVGRNWEEVVFLAGSSSWNVDARYQEKGCTVGAAMHMHIVPFNL